MAAIRPLVTVAWVLAAAASTMAAPAAGAAVPNPGENTARVKLAFRPLPPGAVVPSGWLRDWALAAANGITGHLDEDAATFGEAWKGRAFEARGAHPDGTGWPLEQSSYWLDGAVRLAWILHDQALMAKVGKRLDRVVNGVLNGGATFIYWRPKAAAGDTFNSWAHSHMGRALVAYYEATGQARVLEALVRVYRDYPLPDLRGTFYEVSGANNIDAMVDTYRMSGDNAILQRILAYARRASFRQVEAGWLASQLEPGHNVIFYENARVPAMLYPWTGNPDDLAATGAALAWNDQHHLLPMGVSSGEEYHAGIGATRNVETCDVAASMWTWLWLLRITGKPEYSDRIERAFFNAGAAPVARDFRTMCYYQSANRYSAANPQDEPRNPGAASYRFTPIGHPVLCCVGNLNRIIPNYVMHMWMATPDGGLAATLYGPADVQAQVAGGVRVKIAAVTAYPFAESIDLAITPEQPASFPLHVRIPSWCRNPDVKVNGKPVAASAREGDFLRIARQWRAGDKVRLRFPMAVQIVRGRETPYPRIPYFETGRPIARKAGIASPWASVYYGPLLFALPIPDRNPNQEVAGAGFNAALDTGADPAVGTVQVVRHAMPPRWSWQLDSPIQLQVPVRRFAWVPTDLQPLPATPVSEGTPDTVALVPYGCTKFRVSMFPVTPKTWNQAR